MAELVVRTKPLGLVWVTAITESWDQVTTVVCPPDQVAERLICVVQWSLQRGMLVPPPPPHTFAIFLSPLYVLFPHFSLPLQQSTSVPKFCDTKVAECKKNRHLCTGLTSDLAALLNWWEFCHSSAIIKLLWRGPNVIKRSGRGNTFCLINTVAISSHLSK